jgi:hypothetical protein
MVVKHAEANASEGRFARVRFAAVPFWTAPGFAIPLFQWNAHSNATYVQRVDVNRNIIGFDLFEGGGRVLPLRETLRVEIGDEELFAIVDPFSIAFAGTRTRLAPIVNSWVRTINFPLVRLSFARFCGNKALAIRSAEDAIREKTRELRAKRKLCDGLSTP